MGAMVESERRQFKKLDIYIYMLIRKKKKQA
jgi:hypothetical protein